MRNIPPSSILQTKVSKLLHSALRQFHDNVYTQQEPSKNFIQQCLYITPCTSITTESPLQIKESFTVLVPIIFSINIQFNIHRKNFYYIKNHNIYAQCSIYNGETLMKIWNTVLTSKIYWSTEYHSTSFHFIACIGMYSCKYKQDHLLLKLCLSILTPCTVHTAMYESGTLQCDVIQYAVSASHLGMWAKVILLLGIPRKIKFYLKLLMGEYFFLTRWERKGYQNFRLHQRSK